jgi:hypothetical protein
MSVNGENSLAKFPDSSLEFGATKLPNIPKHNRIVNSPGITEVVSSSSPPHLKWFCWSHFSVGQYPAWPDATDTHLSFVAHVACQIMIIETVLYNQTYMDQGYQRRWSITSSQRMQCIRISRIFGLNLSKSATLVILYTAKLHRQKKLEGIYL